MVKSFALLSVVAAVAVGLVNGAPIKVTRNANPAPVAQPEQPPSESIGRRFPQALAADSPGLAARTSEEVARRFPRRALYEMYAKRDSVDPHRRDYIVEEKRSPEPAPEPSFEELSKGDLNARNAKRSSRRSTAASEKDLYKRTLQRDGVKKRSPKDEPTQKRALRETVERRQYEEFKAKREPTPEPQPAPVLVVEKKMDSRALDALEVRSNPPRESRAFIPRAPASHYPAEVRDSYTWNIHNGDDTIVEVDTTMIAACACDKAGSSGKPCTKGHGKGGKGGKDGKDHGSSTGTATATDSTSTETTHGKGPKGHGSTTATGTSSTPTDTSSSTSTSTSSSSTETGTNAGTPPPGGAQIPPPGGANGAPHSDTTSTATSTSATTTETGATTGDKKKEGDNHASTPPVVTNEAHHRRDMEELLARQPSAKWRRIIPAPSLSRRSKTGNAIQYRRSD